MVFLVVKLVVILTTSLTVGRQTGTHISEQVQSKSYNTTHYIQQIDPKDNMKHTVIQLLTRLNTRAILTNDIIYKPNTKEYTVIIVWTLADGLLA